ncbi:hypothetical protein O9H85_37170 [Paenibacillus filicis]|uniref:Uncharacterized protein n=1 Tax=Paenibacillus gyeongsangnamensis TaxID=3388067 RepID=A0ABT4QLR0_9BACL|nr:hypothetical protein [Paenibacillus filicis]MCZ8517819.1 hypothetical protein [Paenibacillus filicis]
MENSIHHANSGSEQTEVPINSIRRLSFSDRHIDAVLIENVRDYYIQERTIVVNPGMTDAIVGESPEKAVKPLTSAILREVSIKSADKLVLLIVTDTTNIGNVILEPGWVAVRELVPALKDTPLWRSPQDSIGTVDFDPYVITGQSSEPIRRDTFLVKVNVWFATSNSNCAIHNQHDFIEVHTQIYGYGRMQKFKEQDFATLYEDMQMSPGFTTPVPFCSIEQGTNSKYVYPWHQYYADTDCIWLAVEYHPLK